MDQMYRSSIDDEGGVTIPTECLARLGIEPGQEVVMIAERDGLLLVTPTIALKRH
jgi:bifunctional DNA-binding transcriptional regulator/antitoxin component of YhaV-PrlF toxin-antitoxin module